MRLKQQIVSVCGECAIKDPATSNGVSNLQRCRAAGYLTLAAVAKCPIQPLVGFKHATWLVARGNKDAPSRDLFAKSWIFYDAPASPKTSNMATAS